MTLSKHIVNQLKREDVAGIVVTHGTDTLEETAFFLDLTVRSKKPAVMVGAMRLANSSESNGEMNLRDGISLASSKKALGHGVLVVLNGEIRSS